MVTVLLKMVELETMLNYRGVDWVTEVSVKSLRQVHGEGGWRWRWMQEAEKAHNTLLTIYWYLSLAW